MTPREGVSSTSLISILTMTSYTAFCMPVKVTSISWSLRASRMPLVCEMVNSAGSSCMPTSAHLTGSRQVLEMVRVTLSLWSTSRRVNSSASLSSLTCGVTPTAESPKLTGWGLFWMVQTSVSATRPALLLSGLNWSSTGTAYTARSFVSPISSVSSSGTVRKMVGRYAGGSSDSSSLGASAPRNLNATVVSNRPELVILKSSMF
mmetsp:Transcript_40497/g.67855  ORF Transcript_40497/g.67855 Transcript_40497/m.67855 type:complete len:205 (+) Transcript_40497:6288-6902(+)